MSRELVAEGIYSTLAKALIPVQCSPEAPVAAKYRQGVVEGRAGGALRGQILEIQMYPTWQL